MTENKKVFYHAIGNEETIFEVAFKNQLPVLLKGPTGCGKSRFVEAMAEKLSRPLVTVLCNDETSTVDLVGRFLIKGHETVWQDGPVTRAVRMGAILYLDEVAEAREDVITVLHSLTDHRRQLFVDRINETITAPPEFMLVTSYNPGYQRSLKQLKPSTRQRFVAISFDYPVPEVEAVILRNESLVDEGLAKRLVSLATKIRSLGELGLVETVSTRLLVDTGKLIRAGVGARTACDVGIVQPLTDDPEIVASLRDVVSLMIPG